MIGPSLLKEVPSNISSVKRKHAARGDSVGNPPAKKMSASIMVEEIDNGFEKENLTTLCCESTTSNDSRQQLQDYYCDLGDCIKLCETDDFIEVFSPTVFQTVEVSTTSSETFQHHQQNTPSKFEILENDVLASSVVEEVDLNIVEDGINFPASEVYAFCDKIYCSEQNSSCRDSFESIINEVELEYTDKTELVHSSHLLNGTSSLSDIHNGTEISADTATSSFNVGISSSVDDDANHYINNNKSNAVRLLRNNNGISTRTLRSSARKADSSITSEVNKIESSRAARVNNVKGPKAVAGDGRILGRSSLTKSFSSRNFINKSSPRISSSSVASGISVDIPSSEKETSPSRPTSNSSHQRKEKTDDYEHNNLSWLIDFNVSSIFNPSDSSSINSKRDGKLNETPRKPRFTYTELIEQALKQNGQLTVSGIYSWISNRYPYYQQNDDKWKNSVRHNLSINPQFRKGNKASQGAGHYWTISNGVSSQQLYESEIIKSTISTIDAERCQENNETCLILEVVDSIDEEILAATRSIQECENELEITDVNLQQAAEHILSGAKRQVEVQYVTDDMSTAKDDMRHFWESVNGQNETYADTLLPLFGDIEADGTNYITEEENCLIQDIHNSICLGDEFFADFNSSYGLTTTLI